MRRVIIFIICRIVRQGGEIHHVIDRHHRVKRRIGNEDRIFLFGKELGRNTVYGIGKCLCGNDQRISVLSGKPLHGRDRHFFCGGNVFCKRNRRLVAVLCHRDAKNITFYVICHDQGQRHIGKMNGDRTVFIRVAKAYVLTVRRLHADGCSRKDGRIIGKGEHRCLCLVAAQCDLRSKRRLFLIKDAACHAGERQTAVCKIGVVQRERLSMIAFKNGDQRIPFRHVYRCGKESAVCIPQNDGCRIRREIIFHADRFFRKMKHLRRHHIRRNLLRRSVIDTDPRFAVCKKRHIRRKRIYGSILSVVYDRFRRIDRIAIRII